MSNARFVFYNPNPNQRYKKDGTPMKWHGTDCTVRSLAKAMNLSWLAAFKTLCSEAERQLMTYDDIKVLAKVYKTLKFTEGSVNKTGAKPTVNEFCREHKTGTYILSLCGHVVCVVDGKFYDTWDCGSCKVRKYWKK